MIIAYSARLCASKQLLLPNHRIVLHALALLVSAAASLLHMEMHQRWTARTATIDIYWSEKDSFLIGAVETIYVRVSGMTAAIATRWTSLPHVVQLYVCERQSLHAAIGS